MKNLNKGQLKFFTPYLYLAIASAFVFFVLYRYVPHVRVGDGSEYYGLYYAWAASYRPWMTTAAYEAYAHLQLSNQIIGLVPVSALENAFPALKIGVTADFNHFWFYSFLAFAGSKLGSLIGLKLSVHMSFLAAHGALLFLTFSIAYRYYQKRGVFAVFLMMFISPLLWFMDKVHTEFFTCCLVLCAVMLIGAKKYFPAAFFLALASTQNPSFALLALIPLAYRVILQRQKAYSLIEVIYFVGAVLGVLAHPVYYFLRYGVPTPQLIAGGAALGANLSSFYIWLIDPDLGLLPNWPLGSITLLLALGLWISNKDRKLGFSDVPYGVFLILYLVINLYAHSSTLNINSGATPGLARYALWYLPLAFPVFYKTLTVFSGKYKIHCIVTLILIFVISLKLNDPRKLESYTTPSDVSFFIQSKLPWLYNPPPEVFVERYSGYGESAHVLKLRGVVGPDCQKLLLIGGADRAEVVFPKTCRFDLAKLTEYVNSLPVSVNTIGYIKLSDSDFASVIESRNEGA